MESNVIIMKTNKCLYPKSNTFRPAMAYPEYLFPDDISDKENEVYEMVRAGFHMMGFDEEHYGTSSWNPLGEFVSPGDVVVIKPNMVMDVNPAGSTDCLYTQPSVVAPVIDYVLIALQGDGEIIVGDAPMQECNFERLVTESHYKDLIGFYQDRTHTKVSLLDFRDLHSECVNGINHSVVNERTSGVRIDLGQESEFRDADDYFYENVRITNYDPAILKSHHNHEKHEYYVNKNVLRADVIINMPKPKTHRKAGVTISLKNLVGINARKEYLPHHTNGSIEDGGDEYLHHSRLKQMSDKLLDKRNYYMQTKKAYRKAQVVQQANRVVGMISRLAQKDNYREGSWYGNDTISRTIVDLNKILIYTDKEGRLCNEPQRKFLIVADMIISGEKEGPVSPSPKEVGMIAMGTNPVCFDEAIATIMGARLDYIHTLRRARESKSVYRLVGTDEEAWIKSNDSRWDRKRVGGDLTGDSILYFEPTSGWREAFLLEGRETKVDGEEKYHGK